MSWLTKIFGTGAKAAADAVVDTAKGVSDIVERWVPSDAAQHKMKQEIDAALAQSVENARKFNPTSGTSAYSDFLNATVDGLTRLIRPGMTVLIIGAVFGWWPMETHTLDPIVLGWAEAIGAFWFGMRSITRDIPSLIKMLVDLKKGK